MVPNKFSLRGSLAAPTPLRNRVSVLVLVPFPADEQPQPEPDDDERPSSRVGVGSLCDLIMHCILTIVGFELERAKLHL